MTTRKPAPSDDVLTVKLTRRQVAALLILIEQARPVWAAYPNELAMSVMSARNQLEVWQRAASPVDARELDT